MKFAREYQEALQRDEYPPAWVESAISYKKLKKCIKRVQQELRDLGLDHDTLEMLWQQGSLSTPADQHGNPDRLMNYNLSDDSNIKFTPKLTIALDPKDGSPMDAWLSPETRRVLRRYGRRKSSVVIGLETGHVREIKDSDETLMTESSEQSEAVSNDEGGEETEEIETIEIPLTSDSEFFQILRRELANLERLQENEQRHLESEIVQLGDNIRQLSVSKKKKSKEELEIWREIFRLYNDAEVFFSSHEVDAGKRDASHAQRQLILFTKTLTSENRKTTLRLSPEATVALERFLQINTNLLKLLKYQEINQTALNKIMKKFDKQTALHAKEGVLTQINKTPFLTRDLAKATCFTISDELLKIIPQIDDYLCPICFSLSWKPIKLRCGHVFCIRCLIVMQRADQDDCPLCREHVVLEATGDNIDDELSRFLKKNFKREVKEKQRENEIAAGIDQFGEGFTGTHRCVVM